jgi:uncharacterized protein YecE (DUF72 family)
MHQTGGDATAAPSRPIHIGVGGWTYEPWRSVFYPEDLPHIGELEFASSHLTSIEINGTYYGLQKPATFIKWHEETPDDFVFSLKAPRFVTNRRILASAGESIGRFLDSGVLKLKGKLGPINWQFLPTKVFDAADVEAFLMLLPNERAGHRLRHALEVRHDSFRSVDFVRLARRYGVAVVVAGDSPYPQITEATAPFAYARIMGTKKTPKSGYSAAALDRWAACAKSWAAGSAGSDPREVFLYVIGGHKVSNPAAALALIRRVG